MCLIQGPGSLFSTCDRYIVRTELGPSAPVYLLGLPSCLSVAFPGQPSWCMRAVRSDVYETEEFRPASSKLAVTAKVRTTWTYNLVPANQDVQPVLGQLISMSSAARGRISTPTRWGRCTHIKPSAAATVVFVLPIRSRIQELRPRRPYQHRAGEEDKGKPAVASDHVSHSKHEFSRKVAVKQRANRKPVTYISGLQSIDRWWQTAQDFRPATLHAKRGKEINPDLFRYLLAFV